MHRMLLIIQILLLPAPWFIRRFFLRKALGYQISDTARVGLSVFLAEKMTLGERVMIGHLNYFGRLDLIEMGVDARVGNFNWVTGLPKSANSPFFKKFKKRSSQLIMEENSAILHRHMVDCTDTITLERYSGLAGARSQVLTHGIDPIWGHQSCAPIRIGAYSMVGTSCIILKGAIIPACSVVAAGSVVAKLPDESYALYGGNPCVKVRMLPTTSKYFSREGPVVY